MDWGYIYQREHGSFFISPGASFFSPFVQGTKFDQNLLPQTSLDTESLNTIYHLQDLATQESSGDILCL